MLSLDLVFEGSSAVTMAKAKSTTLSSTFS
jgi:hypothetical protein